MTKLAEIDLTPAWLLVRQLVPGYSLEDVQAVTEARLRMVGKRRGWGDAGR